MNQRVVGDCNLLYGEGLIVRLTTERIRARGVGRLEQKVPLTYCAPSYRSGVSVWYNLEYSAFQNPLPCLSLGIVDESELSNSVLAGLAQSEITIVDRDRPVRLVARQVLGYKAFDEEVEFLPGVVDWIMCLPPDRLEAECTLSADLSSRGILEPSFSRIFKLDGTVESSDMLEPFPGLSWMGRNAQSFVLQLDFDRNRASGDNDMQADVLLERPRVRCKFRASAALDHATLLDEMESELEEVLPLFSLLSRRPIWWHRLQVVSAVAGERRRAWSSFRLCGGEPKSTVETSSRWPLVHARLLAQRNTFDQLVASLRSVGERDSLLRAAPLLAASYVERSWEAAYILAVSALEALLSGLEEVTPSQSRVGSTKWNRVAAAVRGALEDRAQAGDLSRSQLESMIEKVSELRRAPLKRVLQHHAARLKVRTDDLWISPEGFEDGINEAFRQRNELLHAGKVSSFEEADGNLWRIRIFTERLFLRIIDCPEDLLAWEHNQEVAWANRARKIRENRSMYPVSSWMLTPKPWRRMTSKSGEEMPDPESQQPESEKV
jgi:hypothetical protein